MCVDRKQCKFFGQENESTVFYRDLCPPFGPPFICSFESNNNEKCCCSDSLSTICGEAASDREAVSGGSTLNTDSAELVPACIASHCMCGEPALCFQ